MNAKQKNFITKELIPFILREQGCGFGMSGWLYRTSTPGDEIERDKIVRPIPICGTVACIGGSIQVLTQDAYDRSAIEDKAPQILGISRRRALGLFYWWRPNANEQNDYRWPLRYAKKFEAADSPLAKAKVVANLLKNVITTNGKCLGPYKVVQE
jgi:hypothetical protein